MEKVTLLMYDFCSHYSYKAWRETEWEVLSDPANRTEIIFALSKIWARTKTVFSYDDTEPIQIIDALMQGKSFGGWCICNAIKSEDEIFIPINFMKFESY